MSSLADREAGLGVQRYVGQVVRAGDLVLPDGTTLVADPDQIVVTLAAPAAEIAEEAAEEAESA